MDQAQFNTIKDRYINEFKSCEQSFKYNKRMYRFLQWSTIILSAITAILAALAQKLPNNFFITFLAITTPIIVSGLATVLTTFNFKEPMACLWAKV
jgi:hypothetical protein